MNLTTAQQPVSLDGIQAVVGIDIGSVTCSYTVLTPAQAVLRKPAEFTNSATGFATLTEQLARLDLAPEQFLVGLEATSRYGENLYYFLVGAGYRVQVLHPAQTHAFGPQRGLRAKTDRLDAGTIARTVLSDEVQPVYVASAAVVAYREVVRLRQNLSAEAARHKLEIQSALQVGFPEYREVFADPTRPPALAVLKVYPSAAAFVEAGVAAVQRTVEEVAGELYGGAGLRSRSRRPQHSPQAYPPATRAAVLQARHLLEGRSVGLIGPAAIQAEWRT